MLLVDDSRDERAMVTRDLAGETHLFHEFIRPYERSAFVMAVSFLHNDADAEDAVHEIFKAFRHLSSFRGEAKFGTWLISNTLNEANTRLRRNTAMPTDSLDADSDDHGHVSPALLRDWREIPSEALERQEVRLMLQEAIAALPDNHREVYLLRDVEELSSIEAAERRKSSWAHSRYGCTERE